MNATSNVRLKIIDQHGKTILECDGEEDRSFLQIAEKHGVEISASCCAGACFVCAAKIISGHDAIQIDKLSIPLVDIDMDHTTGRYKEVLTCIGGIYNSCFKDGKYHEIVLQKLL